MGSQECQGDSSTQVGHPDTVLLKGNESQTQCTAYAGFLPEARFIFSSPSPPNPPSPSPPKTPWAWPDGLSGREQRRNGSFPRNQQIEALLYHFNNCFQYLASINTTCGPARSIECNLLQLKVANVFSIPLSAGC